MSDLKLIIFLISFSIVFVGIMGMIGQHVGDTGEFIVPDQQQFENASYYDGGYSFFDTLRSATNITTGIAIIDNWFFRILGILGVILFLRYIRGQ